MKLDKFSIFESSVIAVIRGEEHLLNKQQKKILQKFKRTNVHTETDVKVDADKFVNKLFQDEELHCVKKTKDFCIHTSRLDKSYLKH
jgi:hypothetical protein